MAQTAVVTGATGFVATELVKQLLAKVGTVAAELIVIQDATDVEPLCLTLCHVRFHTGLQCQGDGAVDQGFRQDTSADKIGGCPAW
jgi:nucleoside-diphosphate-sugar epimerase